MPAYDYRCDANGKTIEVSHPMSESVKTWGELCQRTGTPLGTTPADAPVEKVIPLVAARGGASAKPQHSCGSGCGCFPN